MPLTKIFPSLNIDDLISTYDCNKISDIRRENNWKALFLGGRMMCKTSMLFQAALSIVTNDEHVVYICPQTFDRLPLSVHGIPFANPGVTQHIKIMYASTASDLIHYLSHFHITGSLPGAIFIDDLHHYVTHLVEEEMVEQTMTRICALLKDTVDYCSQKRGEPCHLMATAVDTKNKGLSFNLAKHFFSDLWWINPSSVSTTERQTYFLTSPNMPSIRIYFYIEHGEIFLEKVSEIKNLSCSSP